ncbi:MAG: 50S ribosomal protein L29 [Magnetococcales bacterium]|nr:50S ribosomal protein L29 [Magnetococcales bacterium]
MKASELRELSDAALEEKLGELNKEMFNLRFQVATAQMENTARVRQVRRSIARIHTIRNERVDQGEES